MPEESVTANSNITKEFLEKSTNKSIKSFVVKPGSNIGDNYTSILHSLEIIVENAEKGKVEAMHLLLKCYPEHPARQQFLNQSNLFLKELEVYREFVPKLEGILPEDLKDVLKSPTAGFINGDAIDYDKLNGSEHQGIDYFANYILMLDMRKTRGFKMACRYAGLDYEHSRLIAQALAKFHALSHAYQVKTKNKGTLTQQFPYLKESFVNPNMKGLLSGMLLANIGMVKNALNDFLQNNPEIENGLTKLSSDPFGCLEKYLNSESQENLANLLRINPGKGEEIQDERWTVGGHGDSWLNNMLFRYDETGNPIEAILVDLQMVREGSPLLDLAYFFYTSTTTKLRSKH